MSMITTIKTILSKLIEISKRAKEEYNNVHRIRVRYNNRKLYKRANIAVTQRKSLKQPLNRS